MQNAKRRRWIAILSLVTVLTLGIVISLLVLGSPERDFTATAYSDVIRFQAEGLATLQVRIFDLSGKEVWDSGVVSGWTVDWDRRNNAGERLAYGAYLYNAQGWNASGDLIFQKNGKLALMPGDTVQLQAAPAAEHATGSSLSVAPDEVSYTPKTSYSEDVNILDGHKIHFENSLDLDPMGFALLLRNSTHNKISVVRIMPNGVDWIGSSLEFFSTDLKTDPSNFERILFLARPEGYDYIVDRRGTGVYHPIRFGRGWEETGYNPTFDLTIDTTGNIGIGTSDTTAKLSIEDSTGQDLIAAYNSSNRVFAVTSTGVVRADGAYYGASFNTGSADVAERINVSEWVEAGYVVEIDPEHPGFFRKSSYPYSTNVAGIISTSPGVILGNCFDEVTDDWEDNRPVLAITGRVPCKVSVENGPIEIGDLLVASSTPGIAMKGNPERAIGTVVGKAMEPLQEGQGIIVVQVMLR